MAIQVNQNALNLTNKKGADWRTPRVVKPGVTAPLRSAVSPQGI
jgi:hypothetical protein